MLYTGKGVEALPNFLTRKSGKREIFGDAPAIWNGIHRSCLRSRDLLTSREELERKIRIINRIQRLVFSF